MKANFEICAFVALLLVIKVNCIRVIETNPENSTTIESIKELEEVKENLESQTTISSSDSLVALEPRIIDSNYHITTSTTTSTTTTHKIPPTLLNIKHELNKDVTEKPVRSLKELV
jgi:hypothetical protein